METLAKTKKVTKATLKAFIRTNKDNLFVKEKNAFNGMIDGIEILKGGFKKTVVNLEELKNNKYRPVDGLCIVPNNNNFFTNYEDNIFTGIEVYNCCGCSIVATKK